MARNLEAEIFPDFTPVNLITGFLGSGKTTLLSRLLQQPALKGAAVLINEFGEVGLDHHLLEVVDDNIVLLQSGCLCCTIRGDLAAAMRSLHSKRERGEVPPFDRLLVESTGLADPYPILSTLRADPVLCHHFRCGNVIVTVDAVNGLTQLSHHEESVRQAAAADRLVITKTDLCEETVTAEVRARLRKLNPFAPMFTEAARVDAGDLGLSGQDEGSIGKVIAPDAGGHDHASHHDDKIRSFVVTMDEPIDWTAFGVWLTMLLNRHGEKVLRVKGILNLIGETRPVAVHGVQRLVHPPVHMKRWPDADRRSKIVFIVQDLDPALIRRSLSAFNRIAVPDAVVR
jgi:G3E family GTPase